MSLRERIVEIESLIKKHRGYREACLNLIASENMPSPLVDRLYSAELNHRYGNYRGIDTEAREYQGNRYITRIEGLAQNLAKELFGAEHVDLRPLSGNIAGLAATLATVGPGDCVLEAPNGHRYAKKLASSRLKADLFAKPLPWDGPNSNIDLEKTRELIRRHKPTVVTVGSGIFLFPQPVREIREEMDRSAPDSTLIYDAAHVMGLIAGKRFQDPLREGADIVVSSTHKTLAGPQGGMVLTNDRNLAERIGIAIAPLLESNHHLGRLPALAATFQEWLACGEEHASSIVENAQALGKELQVRGLPMVGESCGITNSHTLHLITDVFGADQVVADRLETCGIIVGAVGAPEELGKFGLRLGVQEVTRKGMTLAHAPAIADCIIDAMNGVNPESVLKRVRNIAQKFNQVRFTLE